jgi:hypothetical protein
VTNLRADDLDLLARRGADQSVRPHGRQPAPGLGDPRGHGRAVSRRRRHRAMGRSARQRRIQRARRPIDAPAATWKARKSASASPAPRCSPSSPRMRPAARSTTCTTAFTALGGMMPLINISARRNHLRRRRLRLYGMLLFVIIAIFVAGLMVGRTPEYVGKKIEAKEVKMAMLAILSAADVSRLDRGRGVVPSAVAGMAIRGRTASPKCSTPTSRPPATTARLRRAQRQHAVLQSHAAPSRCSSAASG